MKRGKREYLPNPFIDARALLNVLNGCTTTDGVFIERADGEIVPAVWARNTRDGKVLIKAWDAGDGK